ncbi:MAG: YicC/YloC family endoribonuclease [Thermoanaerobaculia bacterium]
MRSMTGYGSAARDTADYRIEVTVQSVNHRYLDLALRVPEELRAQEAGLRERVARGITRGRCEVTVSISPVGDATTAFRVRADRVRALRNACEGLIRDRILAATFTLADLASVPGLLEAGQPLLWGEAESAALATALDAALAEMVAAREFEGERLARALLERERSLADLVTTMRARTAAIRAALPAELASRVADLAADVAVPPERLAQEALLLAERADIAEELDRLGSHLEQLEQLVASPDAVGKRLEFLGQELLREINTIASKSRDLALTRAALEGKLLAEQLREQFQNVE